MPITVTPPARALARMTPYQHGRITMRPLDQALSSLQGLRRGARVLSLMAGSASAHPLLPIIRPGVGIFQGGTAARPTGARAARAARVKMAAGVGHIAVMPPAIQHQLALGIISHVELHSSYDGLASLLLNSVVVLQQAKDAAGFQRGV